MFAIAVPGLISVRPLNCCTWPMTSRLSPMLNVRTVVELKMSTPPVGSWM
jgi:hypothetical protein